MGLRVHPYQEAHRRRQDVSFLHRIIDAHALLLGTSRCAALLLGTSAREADLRPPAAQHALLLPQNCKSKIWFMLNAMAEFQKGTPQVGLRFKIPDEALQFWVAYGGCTGFDVRKRYTNFSKYDRKVTSCRYVCANEGYRKKVERQHVTKFRP